jgi:hypothetical protein
MFPYESTEHETRTQGVSPGGGGFGLSDLSALGKSLQGMGGFSFSNKDFHVGFGAQGTPPSQSSNDTFMAELEKILKGMTEQDSFDKASQEIGGGTFTPIIPAEAGDFYRYAPGPSQYA